MGSQEEFESIVGASSQGSGGAGGAGGGGMGRGESKQNYAYKKEKHEQASVEDVLSAAEQYALRFL